MSGSKATMRSKFDPSTSPSSQSRRSRSSWLAPAPLPVRGSGSVRKPTVVARKPANAPVGMISGRKTTTTSGSKAASASSSGPTSAPPRYSWKRVSKCASVPVSSTQASKYVDCPTKARRSGRSVVASMDAGKGSRTASAADVTARGRDVPTTRPLSARARDSTSRHEARPSSVGDRAPR